MRKRVDANRIKRKNSTQPMINPMRAPGVRRVLLGVCDDAVELVPVANEVGVTPVEGGVSMGT